MTNTFSYRFDELPLVIFGAVDAATVDGMAEIEYSRSGVWQVQHVSVCGYRSITQAEREAGVSPWVYVPASVDIELIILGRLNNEWSDRVQHAVSEQIEKDREDALEFRAEMRREARLGVN